MKYFFFIFIALASIIQIDAQNSVLQSFYNDHKDIEEVTSFNIGGNFLKKMVINDEDDREIRSTLNQLYVLNIPFSKVSSSGLNSLKRNIKTNRYEALITYRDGKERVNVYIKEKKDYIEELLVVIEDTEEDFLVLSLSGMILFKDLKHLNLDGRAGEVIRDIER